MIQRTISQLRRFFSIFIVIYFAVTSIQAQKWSKQEETTEYWDKVGKSTLEDILQKQLKHKPAKNVILFLGDGMGLSTMTAGRILKGQKQGKSGEETVTMLDKFKDVGLAKVYSIDKQTPDSASTATAILSGIKTRFSVLGLNGKAKYRDCKSAKGNEVESILEASIKEGKSTGVVTTTQVQHASPAATYAHSASRGWYSDNDMSTYDVRNGCKDIALQLFEKKRNINVILGGGRAYMRPLGAVDEKYKLNSATRGKRRDGRDLIKEWQALEPRQNARYVWNQPQLEAVDANSTDYLMGLFQPFSMSYDLLRPKGPTGEPSLSEMTSKAIEILRKNSNGYFLFVEGGKIDHGHHQNKANLALGDFLAFEKAIETAMKLTSEEDTLIIVTADHGHGFVLGGYADRGNPVHGYAKSNLSPERASDGKLYSAITYANGPGHQGPKGNLRGRVSPSRTAMGRVGYQFQTAVPLAFETHSAEDMVVLARGPMSHLFTGTFEQNYIGHAMKYASCVGSNKLLCQENKINEDNNSKDKEEIKELLDEINEKLHMALNKINLLESEQESRSK